MWSVDLRIMEAVPMSPDDQPSRTYSSPLRENQAQRTRDLILDALTELLATHRVDEVSTKKIAERARVSQPTVYRHFPDRAALVQGLTDRIERKIAESGVPEPETLEEWIQSIEGALRLTDENAAVAIAEAVMNADPRRFTPESRARTENITRAVARSFPELDDRDHRRVAALVRTFISVQTWLRMREEFGIDGAESGPLVTWALTTLVREIRAGNLPPRPSNEPG